jgi:hypothetical protein
MGTKPKVPFAKTKSSDIESFSIAETLPLKDKGKLSFELLIYLPAIMINFSSQIF